MLVFGTIFMLLSIIGSVVALTILKDAILDREYMLFILSMLLITLIVVLFLTGLYLLGIYNAFEI